jgi:HK97 family phage major capsid protein
MNIAVLERDLAQKKEKASTLYEKHMKAAQAHEEPDGKGGVIKGRALTDDEKQEVQALLDDANKTRAHLERAKGDESMAAQIDQLTAGLTKKSDVEDRTEKREQRSLGEQFVSAPEYEFFRSQKHRKASQWTSPGVELHATLLDTSSGSGGPLIVTDFRPGLVQKLFARLTVANLLSSGTTDSNSITYMRETTATNAAATVAEGATKPESALVFDQVTDLVRKIATWLPVTEEMLEDASQIRSYIDARLRLFVQIEEEDQLLNGTTTPPDIVGIRNRTGLATAVARGADANVDAIFKQIMAIFNTSFLMPDGVVLNPANWQTIQLAKDTNGNYIGSGPFAPPQSTTLWGLPVVPTPSQPANEGLVGAFAAAAQTFRKGGLRVEASNSHSTFFVENKVAIRAEERLALAVYRPGAFGKVTGLN